MAPVTVYLISLAPTKTPSDFVKALKQSNTKPLVVARVVQWIVTPVLADHLLQNQWDFTIILPRDEMIPFAISNITAATFSIRMSQNDEMMKNILSIL